MKNVVTLTFICAFALFATTSLTAQNWWKGRIQGEGPIVTRTLDLDRIDAVGLSISANVHLRQGSTQSVEIKAQQNIIDNILTEVSGGYWKIKYDQPVSRTKEVEIYLTVKDLKAVYVSGSGDVKGYDSFRLDNDLDIAVSGSGGIELDFTTRGSVDAKISGSGDIRLEGEADELELKISGSGDIEADDLRVKEAYVSISGSGDVTVHATEFLEVATSGSGDVRYRGTPRLKARSSGSGDVESM